MNGKKGKQMSETFCLGALLAVTGGFLDAYTYLTRGRVFANAQTGNLVLLAMNLAGGQFQGRHDTISSRFWLSSPASL